MITEAADPMLDVLVVIAYFAGLLLCVAIAVDVMMQHPYDWSRTGSSQKLRLSLIAAPLLAIFCVPLGLALGLFYILKVRPLLTRGARIAAGQGWPVPARRAVLGLGWVWRELQTWQRVKAVLAVVGATLVDIMLILVRGSLDGVPRWFDYAGLVFLWPTLFGLCYLGLSAVQVALPAVFRDSGGSPAQARIQQLADQEYQRRYAEFQQRYTPRPPWEPPWEQQRR